jgi:hypothetical protein
MVRAKCSFWSDGTVEEHYVVKQKKGNEKLTVKNAIHDHISNSIYQIFGVSTPSLYIGYYQKELSLISRVLPGYKDLIEWLGGDKVLEEINQHRDVAVCVATYKKLESRLSIKGKESLLAAAIILEDTDVIGAGLRNIGLVETSGQHCIMKIDPSDSIFSASSESVEAALVDFEENLSLAKPFILGTFSFSRIYNNPQSILGNLHFDEFFHGIDKGKLKMELAKFAHLDDASIKQMVMREEYLELLPMDDKKTYLERLANLLLRKKAILKKVLNVPEIQVKPPELAPVFMKDLVLSDSSETIEHGASKPLKVKRVMFPKEVAPNSVSVSEKEAFIPT